MSAGMILGAAAVAPAVAAPVTPDSSISIQVAAKKMWKSAKVSSVHSTEIKATKWGWAEAKKLNSWSGYKVVSVNANKVWNGKKYVWHAVVQYVYWG